jgi:uncharacterized repeat protein (TIGR02543 family)
MKKMLVILMLFLPLSACANDDTATYTITFYDANNAVIETVEVNEFEDAVPPNDPLKEGYVFDGWSESLESIQSDLDVYPTFSLDTSSATQYTLTVSIDGTVVDSFSLSEGDSLPTLEYTQEGYQLDGWYLDAAYTMESSYERMPPMNVTLYATWDEISVDDAIRTDTNYYFSTSYGNTNGNLHNMGLAVYDFNREMHLYSANHSIYAFDPSTLVFTRIYEHTNMEMLTHLNIYDDTLFFIDSSNGYLYTLDLLTYTAEVVLDEETLYFGRASYYLYAQFEEESYGSLYLKTVVLDDETYQRTSMSTHSRMFINLTSSRFIYQEIGGTHIRLSAYNFYGTTTYVYLDDYNMINIQQMLIGDYATKEVALLTTVDEIEGLYLYQNDTLKTIATGDITGLNYNGEHYYFLKDGWLKQVDPESLTVEDIVQVGNGIDRINIVQNWMYLMDSTTHNVYQYDPLLETIERIN